MGGKSISGQQTLCLDRRDLCHPQFILIPKPPCDLQYCHKQNNKTPTNKIQFVWVQKSEMIEFEKIYCIKPWGANKTTQKGESQIHCVQQNLRSANSLTESSDIDSKAVRRGQNLYQWYWPHCGKHRILQPAKCMLWFAEQGHELHPQQGLKLQQPALIRGGQTAEDVQLEMCRLCHTAWAQTVQDKPHVCISTMPVVQRASQTRCLQWLTIEHYMQEPAR